MHEVLNKKASAGSYLHMNSSQFIEKLLKLEQQKAQAEDVEKKKQFVF